MHAPASLLTRRRLLQFAAGSGLGLHLGGLWQAQAAAEAAGTGAVARNPVRACILIFYYGGPSHLDTFDMKPEAPAEVRGEFRPISTSVPGVQICEHLPRLARWMHKIALVRSVTHAARLHDSASIHALTGRPLEGPDRELFAPQPQFYPCYGSAVAYVQRTRQSEAPFASLPFTFRNVHDVPCQGGGFLGAAYDPLRIEADADAQRYRSDVLVWRDGLNAQRLDDRRRLLANLEVGGGAVATERTRIASDPLQHFRHRASRLLESDAIRRAVDISQEPQALRERYGFGPAPLTTGEGGGGGNGAELGTCRQMRGQNLLLARRLVECGVPFVNVYDFKQQGQNWDAHFKCFSQHKNHLLPQADQSLAALLEDLNDRGLLESTLVVAMGEFGRTPKINGDGGRDHWPDCYTVLLAGGGVRGGAIYGASDRLGAYPALDAVTPGDLAATIYWRFGIDPALEIRDAEGRPHALAAGEPLVSLFG